MIAKVKEILPWLIIIFVAVIGFFLIKQFNLFTVTRTRCFLDSQDCSHDISKQIDQLGGRSIFFTDFPEVITNDLLLGYPDIKVLDVQKQLNGQVVVKLSQNSQKYLVMTRGEQKKHFIDFSGHVTDQANEERLIKIIIPDGIFQTVEDERALPPELAERFSQIVAITEKTEFEFQQLIFKEPDLMIYKLPGQLQAVVLLSKPDLIQDIPTILSGITDSSLEGIKEIDLRFKLPILRESITF